MINETLSPARRHRLYRLWPIGIFLLSAILFLRFFNHSIIFRDSFYIFPALKYYVAQGWRSGRIMAWNPWQFMGMPYVADILSGWFYPLNVVFLILPFEPAYRVFILIHYPLAAVFMIMLLRRLGLNPAAAMLGGLSFALSGYMISMHANLVYLIGPAWAPLAIYFMVRALYDQDSSPSLLRGIAWSIAAAAVLALQILGGEPQSAAITASIIALISVYAFLQNLPGQGDERKKRAAGIIIALLSAGIFSFALSAIQIFPSYEMLGRSVRRAGLSLAESGYFSFHPGSLVELFWPWAFGTYWPEMTYWGGFAYEHSINRLPWSINNYLGLPVLTIAGLGLIKSRRSWKWAVLAGLVFFMLLALGYHTPFFSAFYYLVPVFHLFRYPMKYLAWFSGCVSMAAALGLDAAGDIIGRNPRRSIRLALLYILTVILVAGLFWYLCPKLIPPVSGNQPGSEKYAAIMAQLFSAGRQFLMVNIIIGTLPLLLLKNYISASRVKVLFLVVVLVDLWSANVNVMPAGSPWIYKFRPVIAEVISPGRRPDLGRFRIFRDALEFRRSPSDLASFTYFERMDIWQRQTLVKNLHALEGFEDLLGYNEGKLSEGFETFESNLSPALFLLYNVRYVISSYDSEPINDPSATVIYKNLVYDCTVTELTAAFPRAYWVGSAKRAGNDKEAINMLDRTDLSRSVIITSEQNIDEGQPADLKLVPAAITRYETDEVSITLDAPAPGWLVLSDRLYPGWRAEVDQTPAQIYKANVFVRAVKVPAGRHNVVFKYQPPSLREGAAVSIPAWIAAVILWITALVKSRKAGNGER